MFQKIQQRFSITSSFVFTLLLFKHHKLFAASTGLIKHFIVAGVFVTFVLALLCFGTPGAAQTGTGFNAKINFQPASAPVPTGYMADTGAVYGDRGNGYTYGWDADSSAHTRDRDASNSPDQRYDTLVHMQLYGTFTWEIAVPNGTYTVRVVAGDPQIFNSVYKIAAEGVLTVDGTPTSTTPWVEGTQTVTVSDGKLTINNALGASNNKLCFVDISSTTTGGNSSPATPTITAPATDGFIVNQADVHMETSPAFSDPNPGDTHVCTDWEVWTISPAERVWVASCIGGPQKYHIHIGDGVFENSHAGRTDFRYDTDYRLRARFKDSSGDPNTQWSAWAERLFRTASQPATGGPITWTVTQPGYQVEIFASGFELPVNVAFVPNPGPNPNDVFCYVTELYGQIKVVTRNGTISDYLRGALNYRPSGIFPGSGEQGLAGIVVEPATGDVFVSMLYDPEGNTDGPKYPKVVRYFSNNSGRVANTSTTILDMVGEDMYESHQISNLSIGPDGKLYVHMGDGFDSSTAQNLNLFRGKILRVNLDGSAPTDNPFYNASDGINAKDYVYAYGFRNPFGGIWRAADNFHYTVENGPSVDRFAKVVRGRNYLWDGSDASMSNYAIYNWSPATAPVNIAFIQSSTFGGSGFPADKMDHAFVSESGPTWATGPQGIYGKRISEFVLDASGNLVSGPATLVEYTGTGKATAVGLTAGPDGLYFTDLYVDQRFDTPVATGANVLRIKYVGTNNASPTVSITSPTNNATFTAPATIAIEATASDSDGTVSKVEFFQGATKLGEDTTAPYSFTWSNVAAGNYSLTAKATDNAGATTTSSVVSITVNGVPAAPTGLTATAGNAQVSLSWASAAGATSYNVKRSTTNGGPYATIATGVTATSYTDAGLTNGTTYFYVVSAVNATGESANSTQASAAPQAPAPSPPAAPTNLVATVVSTSQINLTWNDNSTNETGFRIERCLGSNCTNFAFLANVGQNTSNMASYNNTGLNGNTWYTYRVRAFNDAGNSAYSNAPKARTPR